MCYQTLVKIDHDSRVGSHEVCVLLLALGPVLERSLGEVDFGHGFGEDLGAESLALSSELVHHLWASNTIGESGEVLNVGGGGELASGSESVQGGRVIVASVEMRWSILGNINGFERKVA